MFWTKKKCPVLLLDAGELGKKWDKFKGVITAELARIE